MSTFDIVLICLYVIYLIIAICGCILSNMYRSENLTINITNQNLISNISHRLSTHESKLNEIINILSTDLEQGDNLSRDSDEIDSHQHSEV